MAESMRGMKRTCRCAELSEKNIGEEVTMMGWVQKQRNKGGIIFVDMRDRSGILQVIFEDGEINEADFAKAEKLRSEFVIAVKGKVTARSGAVNENLATGAIELRAEELRVLSESDTPPFPIEADSKTKEELRLKYRYLDLRRPDLQRNLIMRSKVATLIRQFLADEGFLEIETPMLTKSTPEGARDYLVPSRVHPGTFYALPQSPQLFKQLLMCSGYDRYFQLARCFRDEDLRADRQPEFTQVDMELSFVDEDDVMDVNERLLQKLFKEILDAYYVSEGYLSVFDPMPICLFFGDCPIFLPQTAIITASAQTLRSEPSSSRLSGNREPHPPSRPNRHTSWRLPSATLRWKGNRETDHLSPNHVRRTGIRRKGASACQ